ncbi:hypothetical protein D9M71_582610 [compost metagenome]
MREGGFGDPAYMDDAIDYVTNADVPALREALASGDCSTSLFSSCRVLAWLDEPVGR